MKTVLFIHQSAEMYGSDKMLLYLVSGLDASRFRTIVILPTDGPLKLELDRRGVETLIAPVAKISRSVFTPMGLLRFQLAVLSSLLGMLRVLAGRPVDVVHSNTLAVFSGAVWSLLHHRKHVWHVHEIIERPLAVRRGFPLLLSLFADKVATISKAVADNLVSERPSLSKKIEVIHNGMTPDEPTPKEEVWAFRNRLGLGEKEVLLALVGRINRWKGQHLFLSAAEILVEQGVKNVAFCMVGGPPQGQDHFWDELKAATAASPARACIHLVDYMEKIRVVWDSCDIAVVSSTEPEPFGMVALEAMASAKPVVAARHGGLTEIVLHKETGLLFEPNKSQALAAELTLLISDKALRESMGAAGRMRLESDFSLARYVRSFERLYEGQ
jgi:glycosyltransferase involved in cell wall biosynthesis